MTKVNAARHTGSARHILGTCCTRLFGGWCAARYERSRSSLTGLGLVQLHSVERELYYFDPAGRSVGAGSPDLSCASAGSTDDRLKGERRVATLSSCQHRCQPAGATRRTRSGRQGTGSGSTTAIRNGSQPLPATCHAEGRGFESHHPLLNSLQAGRCCRRGSELMNPRGKVKGDCCLR
jgi:hypothetical protein